MSSHTCAEFPLSLHLRGYENPLYLGYIILNVHDLAFYTMAQKSNVQVGEYTGSTRSHPLTTPPELENAPGTPTAQTLRLLVSWHKKNPQAAIKDPLRVGTSGLKTHCEPGL